jgi:hypothetical protein
MVTTQAPTEVTNAKTANVEVSPRAGVRYAVEGIGTFFLVFTVGLSFIRPRIGHLISNGRGSRTDQPHSTPRPPRCNVLQGYTVWGLSGLPWCLKTNALRGDQSVPALSARWCSAVVE